MKEIFTYMFQKDNLKQLSIFYAYIFCSVLFCTLAGAYNPINMFGELSPLFIIFIICGILIVPLTCGYGISTIKNNIDKNNQLPNSDIKTDYITGAKLLASIFILLLLLFFIFFIFGFINNFFIRNNLTPLAFMVATTSFLITIVSSFFLMASFNIFSKTGDILSFVKYPTIVNIINKNVNIYCKYFLVFVLLIIITLFIKSFLFYSFNFFGFLGLFLYTILLSVVYTYAALICTKMIANSVNE